MAQSERDRASAKAKREAKNLENDGGSKNRDNDSRGSNSRRDRDRTEDRFEDGRGGRRGGRTNDRAPKDDRAHRDGAHRDGGKSEQDRRDGAKKVQFKVGANAHKVDGSKPGFLKIGGGAHAVYHDVKKIRKLLVEDFGYTKDKADLMCIEVGLDMYDDAALCPCAKKTGHLTADDTYHKFPKDFHSIARKLTKR